MRELCTSSATLTLAISLITLLSPCATAEPLESPAYFARASTDLAQGIALTPANVSIIKFTDSDQIPRGAMWLTAADEAYGFKLHIPRKKGEAITGNALLASCSGHRNLAAQSTDPPWEQYAKLSIAYDVKHNFDLSHQHEERAITELDKLAKSNQHLTYMDEECLIFDMLQHSKQTEAEVERFNSQNAAQQKADDSRPPVAGLQLWLGVLGQIIGVPMQTSSTEVFAEELEQTNAKAARDRRLCSILSAVLPSKCQLVRFLEDDLKRDTAELERFTKLRQAYKAKFAADEAEHDGMQVGSDYDSQFVEGG